MAELADVQVSKELDLKIELVGGDAKLSAVYTGKDASVSIVVTLHPDLLLDHVKGIIPGGIDDAVIELVKAAIKKA